MVLQVLHVHPGTDMSVLTHTHTHTHTHRGGGGEGEGGSKGEGGKGRGETRRSKSLLLSSCANLMEVFCSLESAGTWGFQPVSSQQG